MNRKDLGVLLYGVFLISIPLVAQESYTRWQA